MTLLLQSDDGLLKALRFNMKVNDNRVFRAFLDRLSVSVDAHFRETAPQRLRKERDRRIHERMMRKAYYRKKYAAIADKALVA